MSARDDDEQGFGLTTVMFTLIAVVLAFVALAVAAAALDSSNNAKDEAKAAWDSAWPVLRHVVAAERARLEAAGRPRPIDVAVHRRCPCRS